MDDIEMRQTLQPIVNTIDNDENPYFRRLDAVISAIQLAKTLGLTPEILKQRSWERGIRGGKMVKFMLIYEAYQTTLHRQGKLDFTDLILNAIGLLETHPDIAAKYQARFHYIIEDEAQDSSHLLQRFIHLLSAKHGNLIRTGDTNQSITTTFSSADTDVFRGFIQECHQNGLVVTMDHSGRCAPEVMDVANRFIQWACHDEVLKNAFQPVTMVPVSGMNPGLLEPLQANAYPTSPQEQEGLLHQIGHLQQSHPKNSIALLLRNNSDVLAYTRFLQEHGIKAISYTDSPDLNPAFLAIVYTLNVLEDPSQPELFQQLCNHLHHMGLLALPQDSLEAAPQTETLTLSTVAFLNQNPSQIAHEGLLQLYYNLHDLMRFTFGQDICSLIVKVTDRFLIQPHHRSIGYLCALKAQNWVNRLAQAGLEDRSPLEWVNQEFQQCLERKRLPFKVVQEGADIPDNAKGQFVQVMTLHKSKGQEFDFVFIPGMSEKSFPSLTKSVQWGESDKLAIELQQLNQATPIASEILKAGQITKKVEEEARLVYVGITRARKGLFLSYPMEARNWHGKPEAQVPSRYFDVLSQLMPQATSPQALINPTSTEVVHAG
jgi:DNA helicase-2/ATP-dependent DNA helicase PcrA